MVLVGHIQGGGGVGTLQYRPEKSAPIGLKKTLMTVCLIHQHDFVLTTKAYRMDAYFVVLLFFLFVVQIYKGLTLLELQ